MQIRRTEKLTPFAEQQRGPRLRVTRAISICAQPVTDHDRRWLADHFTFKDNP